MENNRTCALAFVFTPLSFAFAANNFFNSALGGMRICSRYVYYDRDIVHTAFCRRNYQDGFFDYKTKENMINCN